MSATLTWFNSGLGAKTGTTITALLNDLETLIDSKAADADFSWEVASKNSASTPYYLVLKRNDGSAGRILLIHYSSNPANFNSAIFKTNGVSSSSVYCSFFPNGNVDTPSNLTAASGTILGDDTDCNYLLSTVALSSVYPAGYQAFYFDSEEAVYFGFSDPTTATTVGFGAGYLFVDANDVAYPGVIRPGATSLSTFSVNASAFMTWVTTNVNATNSNGCMETNYGADHSLYFHAWQPAGNWAQVVPSSTDILTDTANNKAWFVPIPLLGQRKGEGFVLKLRQIAHGPGSTAAFTAYTESGPTVMARQFCPATIGGDGFPWFTNFKL